MIVRLGLKMGVFVVCARWMYAEVQLVAPGVVPLIDAALERVQIPTHDTWDEHYSRAREVVARIQRSDEPVSSQVAGLISDYRVSSTNLAKTTSYLSVRDVSLNASSSGIGENLREAALTLMQSKDS